MTARMATMTAAGGLAGVRWWVLVGAALAGAATWSALAGSAPVTGLPVPAVMAAPAAQPDASGGELQELSILVYG